MGRMAGKVALVTGGASGIGRAGALTLAREGATVAVTDIDEAGAAETAAMIRQAGGRASHHAHDVGDEPAWKAVLARVQADHGALHVLVNNAGIVLGGKVVDVSLADWRRQHAVNLDGTFLGLKHAIPVIARSGGGAVVNISSIAGLVGDPGYAAYSAAKGGVTLLTKTVALECAKAGNGVRVNSIHPGVIDTPIWVLEGMLRRMMLATIAKVAVPMGHAGTPQDVADGILFLASDEAGYITGAELVIDGGLTAR